MFGRTRTRFAAPWSSASCGKVDPVFRVKRCAAQEKHRMDPKVESTFGSDAHRAEKGTRFSALNDALLKDDIGWIPKVGSFWVRCAHRAL